MPGQAAAIHAPPRDGAEISNGSSRPTNIKGRCCQHPACRRSGACRGGWHWRQRTRLAGLSAVLALDDALARRAAASALALQPAERAGARRHPSPPHRHPPSGPAIGAGAPRRQNRQHPAGAGQRPGPRWRIGQKRICCASRALRNRHQPSPQDLGSSAVMRACTRTMGTVPPSTGDRLARANLKQCWRLKPGAQTNRTMPEILAASGRASNIDQWANRAPLRRGLLERQRGNARATVHKQAPTITLRIFTMVSKCFGSDTNPYGSYAQRQFDHGYDICFDGYRGH